MRHFYIVVDSMLLLKPFKFEQVNILLQWIADDTGTTFDHMHVSTAYNKYRLWWGANGVVYFMDLPKDIIIIHALTL